MRVPFADEVSRSTSMDRKTTPPFRNAEGVKIILRSSAGDELLIVRSDCSPYGSARERANYNELVLELHKMVSSKRRETDAAPQERN